MSDHPFTSPEAADEFAHLFEHSLQQQDDCSRARDIRALLLRAVDRWSTAERMLNRIMGLEVHGGEFVDAAELYRILGKPIPKPINHAASIRAQADGSAP